MSASPLFDLAARHLDEYVPLNGIAANQTLVKDFYAAYAKRKPGEDILSILEDTKLSNLFNFSAREADSTHQRRVILMHLLNHGILVGQVEQLEEQETATPPLLNEKENQELLDVGYHHYLETVQNTLSKPSEKLKGAIRDLTLPQQKSLLQVSRDFEVIGTLSYPYSLSKKETLEEVEKIRKLSRFSEVPIPFKQPSHSIGLGALAETLNEIKIQI